MEYQQNLCKQREQAKLTLLEKKQQQEEKRQAAAVKKAAKEQAKHSNVALPASGRKRKASNVNETATMPKRRKNT